MKTKDFALSIYCAKVTRLSRDDFVSLSVVMAELIQTKNLEFFLSNKHVNTQLLLSPLIPILASISKYT